MTIPIDWIATGLALAGMWVLPSRHKRWAIVLFLVGNIIWLVWGLQAGHPSIVFYYLVMGGLNARTLITWMREARPIIMQPIGVK